MKKLLPKTSTNTQGFTLVELMVVIAIIAILAVVGMTVFTGIQKNSRDARRKADVESISAALETGYVQNSATPYPALTTAMFAGGATPKDPSNNTTAYTITPALPAATYCVCTPVVLENGGGNYGAADCTTAGTTYYCKKNQQ